MADTEMESESTPVVRWDKPKIMLMDLPENVEAALKAEGYNVSVGSFGKPYNVEMTGEYSPLIVDGNLRNFSEQEIVIIDLMVPDPTDSPQSEPDRSLDQLDWWVHHTKPVVDPRPCLMMSVRDQLDRIIDHGGLVVVFALPRHANRFVWARKRQFRGLEVERELDFDNWSFSSLFEDDNIVISGDCGEELTANESQDLVSAFFRRHAKQMKYFATFAPRYRLSSDSTGHTFFPLVMTKYKNQAGGVILDPKQKGWAFILPQCSHRQKEYVLVDLLQNVATDTSPHLFPHLEGGRWVQGQEYEHPSVIDLKNQQSEIRTKAQSRIQEIDERIAVERDNLGYLHGILTKKSTPLVKDVKIALETLGFAQVVDADEHQDEGAPMQEDLQIHDKSPTLLVEVKGLSGFPREDDTLQIVKYIPRRMKEWNRTDVSGIVIVNHQCNLPALKRDDDKVFTEQQIQDAVHQDVTLVTTWELFKLLRGQQRWNWPTEAVTSLFYGNGRIVPAPANFGRVGAVAHFYDKASVVSIEIDEGKNLRVGDTIGFILKDRYYQETIESMQVEKTDVEEAIGGQRAGHRTSLPRQLLSDGLVVYIVS